MGRKKKEKIGTFDRIGEEVNLEKCPECAAHPDCFAWKEGRCTALNESGGEDCVFYCSADIAAEKARQGFKRLMELKRTDLIQKYFKALSALGLLDQEIDAVCRIGEQLSNGFSQDPLEGFSEQDREEVTDGTDDGECRDPVE